MISARNKIKDSGGIEGYEISKVHNAFDKPMCYSIAKPTDKRKDFLSLIEKREKARPGPSTYK